MAENLVRRGLAVTIIEMTNQVMPPFDPEMAAFVATHLRANGVHLRLGSAVQAFHQRSGGGLSVRTTSGDTIDTDIVILGIGVQPEASLAQNAGLFLGERGGIRVDDRMQTSDPHIWAVGDVVEVRDVVTDSWQVIPLAGPANRQGRIAAASILGEARAEASSANGAMHFRGVQGTAVCGVFGLTVAMTGASEKVLKRSGIENYQKVYLHPGSHVGYYPGARAIVARRIDVIAMTIQMGGTVYDLEEAELCYAPQFGAAKDPVNLAGMIAANHLRGDLPLADWEALGEPHTQIVDVRSVAEYEGGHIPGAKNLPLDELRGRLEELSRDRDIWLVCEVGQRAYYATRVLLQNGFKVKNLSGGMRTYATFEGGYRDPLG
jgi:rhodanese-related sulfurtransferase